MNTRGIIMLAGGAIAGYLIYDKFIKKNGGETTESFASRSPRRVYAQRAGTTLKPCYVTMYGCSLGNCEEICRNNGGELVGDSTCKFKAGSPQCSRSGARRSL